MAANVAIAATMAMGMTDQHVMGTVMKVADAAETIDEPKTIIRHITKEQTQRACNPKQRYDVRQLSHIVLMILCSSSKNRAACEPSIWA